MGPDIGRRRAETLGTREAFEAYIGACGETAFSGGDCKFNGAGNSVTCKR